MSIVGTKWCHKDNAECAGVVTDHSLETGRIVIKRDDGRVYRGRIGNLRENWEQVK